MNIDLPWHPLLLNSTLSRFPLSMWSTEAKYFPLLYIFHYCNSIESCAKIWWNSIGGRPEVASICSRNYRYTCLNSRKNSRGNWHYGFVFINWFVTWKESGNRAWSATLTGARVPLASFPCPPVMLVSASGHGTNLCITAQRNDNKHTCKNGHEIQVMFSLHAAWQFILNHFLWHVSVVWKWKVITATLVHLLRWVLQCLYRRKHRQRCTKMR